MMPTEPNFLNVRGSKILNTHTFTWGTTQIARRLTIVIRSGHSYNRLGAQTPEQPKREKAHRNQFGDGSWRLKKPLMAGSSLTDLLRVSQVRI